MEASRHFWSICIYERNRILVEKTYTLFPEKIKKLILRNGIYVTDMFDKSIDPNKPLELERLGLYIPPKAIYITPKNETGLKDIALIGLVAHEIAHAKIYFTFPVIRFFMKIYFKIRRARLPYNLKYLHRYLPEEMYANYLARKWGFDNELKALYMSRIAHAKTRYFSGEIQHVQFLSMLKNPPSLHARHFSGGFLTMENICLESSNCSTILSIAFHYLSPPPIKIGNR